MPKQDRGKRFKEIATTIRNRDAGKCRRCNVPESDVRLSVHHLVADSEVPDGTDAHLPVNLVTLCNECHQVLESKSLLHQLREMGIEDQKELILSEQQRQNLNDRLNAIDPDILDVKKISEAESVEFAEALPGPIGEQREITDFGN